MLFVSILILIGASIIIFLPEESQREINPGNKVITGRTISKPATDITYNNLPNYLSRNAVIKDIPDNAKILFRFYNFNSGLREYEKDFVLTKGKVEEGTIQDPDLTIIIHSKYLEDWNSGNFCTIMSRANKNGDLAYSSDLSTTKLLWKFKSMNKHKSCFGL